MKYRHIIFDVDGTIVDSFKTAMCSLQVTVEHFLGEKWSLEKLSPYFGLPSRVTVSKIPFASEEKEAALHHWEGGFVELVPLIKPFEGVDALLRRLHAEGFRLGVITARTRMEWGHDPNMKPWMHLFDTVITSEDCTAAKPDPAQALAYLEKSGAAREECLYIGDAPTDALCAEGAGIDFALAYWHEIPDRLTLPHKYLVRNAEEIYSAATAE